MTPKKALEEAEALREIIDIVGTDDCGPALKERMKTCNAAYWSQMVSCSEQMDAMRYAILYHQQVAKLTNE